MKSQPPPVSLSLDKTASEETVQVGAPVPFTLGGEERRVQRNKQRGCPGHLWTEDTNSQRLAM